MEAPAAVTEHGQATVLVTEDDAFVRGHAIACLQSLGYQVITAANGQEALDRLERGAQPDVLFTDIVMPGGISGWDLAERVRVIRPSIKVLFTSGYALETLAERGRLRPGVAVLNKPYRKAELALRLREILEAPP